MIRIFQNAIFCDIQSGLRQIDVYRTVHIRNRRPCRAIKITQLFLDKTSTLCINYDMQVNYIYNFNLPINLFPKGGFHCCHY